MGIITTVYKLQCALLFVRYITWSAPPAPFSQVSSFKQDAQEGKRGKKVNTHFTTCITRTKPAISGLTCGAAGDCSPQHLPLTPWLQENSGTR